MSEGKTHLYEANYFMSTGINRVQITFVLVNTMLKAVLGAEHRWSFWSQYPASGSLRLPPVETNPVFLFHC